jgi:hypothetical protein
MIRRLIVITLAILSLALYWTIDWPEKADMTGGHIVTFLYTYGAVFLVYIGLLYAARKLELFSSDKKTLFVLLAIALIARGVVAVNTGEHSYTSDDVYRYIWEGKLVAHCYNPLLYSPEDLAHSGLADSTMYPKINHHWLPTIYPPLSQYLFAAAWLIGGDHIFGFKTISLLFELLSLLVLFFFIRQARLPSWTWLIWLFSPLVIIEFIMSNHLDILAMPFLVLAMIFILRERPVESGLFLAMATMVKLFGLFFTPVLFFFFKGRKRVLFFLSYVVTCVIFYLPFAVSAGPEVFGSLWEYLGNWQYNASIFFLLKNFISEELARQLCGGLFLLVVALVTFYKRSRFQPLERMAALFGTYVILTPSLFPWYLVWIVPFLIYRLRLSFLILTGTVFLPYYVLIGYYNEGQWPNANHFIIAEYVPFYLILIYELIRQIRKPKAALT